MPQAGPGDVAGVGGTRVVAAGAARKSANGRRAGPGPGGERFGVWTGPGPWVSIGSVFRPRPQGAFSFFQALARRVGPNAAIPGGAKFLPHRVDVPRVPMRLRSDSACSLRENVMAEVSPQLRRTSSVDG